MKLIFPITIETTAKATGEVKTITLTEKDKGKLKGYGVTNQFKLVSYLNSAFQSSNFTWKFV